METTHRNHEGSTPDATSPTLAGVFADLRAVARLLKLRARELDRDDAEEIGYLAQLVETHAEQGLERIAALNGKKPLIL